MFSSSRADRKPGILRRQHRQRAKPQVGWWSLAAISLVVQPKPASHLESAAPWFVIGIAVSVGPDQFPGNVWLRPDRQKHRMTVPVVAVLRVQFLELLRKKIVPEVPAEGTNPPLEISRGVRYAAGSNRHRVAQLVPIGQLAR